ncbi:ATP-binding cassette domain-containing protein, partial [Escherichia coli]|uniref:ATP-binding cassette domain-containing protein n=1 Tax=Escherichia coli TaxID=562 RepID=UPI00128EF187
ENMRIRREPIRFSPSPPPPMAEGQASIYIEWGSFEVNLDGFKLIVHGGKIHEGEVIGILGPNGIGKTTFVRTFAGDIEKDRIKGEPPKQYDSL